MLTFVFTFTFQSVCSHRVIASSHLRHHLEVRIRDSQIHNTRMSWYFQMSNLPSVMMMLKVQLAVLPDSSLNTYVTWVLPTLKADPGAWDLDIRKMVPPELSVAVGSVHETGLLKTPGSTVSNTSSMQAIVGGIMSVW